MPPLFSMRISGARYCGVPHMVFMKDVGPSMRLKPKSLTRMSLDSGATLHKHINESKANSGERWRCTAPAIHAAAAAAYEMMLWILT